MHRRTFSTRPAIWFAAALVALSAASCAKQESAETTTGDTAQVAVLTDANIVAIFVAANDADIKTGEQAKGKAQSTQVKDFADRMIQDHTAANNDAKDLANRLGISPTDDATSQQMKNDADAMRDSLGQASGNAYDRSYVDAEVTFHEKVLNALDTTLIPNAQNAELKALLERARPIIQGHLDHARSLQTQLAGGQ